MFDSPAVELYVLQKMISEVTYQRMDSFPLKWRFTDPEYSVIETNHLEQIRPLAQESAKKVWNAILDSELHLDFPFRQNYFRHIESCSVPDEIVGEESCLIRKWLYQCAIPFDHKVILSWQPDCAVETTWKMFVKYWSDFFYSGSDDLTVCDQSLQWAILCFHEGEIYFGTNESRQ